MNFCFPSSTHKDDIHCCQHYLDPLIQTIQKFHLHHRHGTDDDVLDSVNFFFRLSFCCVFDEQWNHFDWVYSYGFCSYSNYSLFCFYELFGRELIDHCCQLLDGPMNLQRNNIFTD